MNVQQYLLLGSAVRQTRHVLIVTIISLKHWRDLCCVNMSFLLLVNTMKRTGEKKRFGKGFLPSHEFPNEQTKESYLIEIGELTKRLER